MYEVRDFKNAITILSKSVELNPRHLSVINYLGLCHMELGKYEEALGFFDEAIRINPSYKYAHDNRKIAIQTINKNKNVFTRLFGRN